MKRAQLDKPYQFFFATLGNRTRWEIVHLLMVHPYRATDIAKRLGYEQSLVSHHLQRLSRCGFIRVQASGTERMYHLNRATITPLLRLVERHVRTFCTRVCCE